MTSRNYWMRKRKSRNPGEDASRKCLLMPARATVSGIEEATTIANALTTVPLKDESVLL
jgi:hypothetical protein